MNTKLKIMFLIGSIALPQAAYPDQIGDTYATGDTLTADMLNNIKSAVNGNDTNISTNASNISTNAAGVSSNASSIGTNTSNISSNASNISSNALGITSNAASISGNAAGISTNSADIATNASAISSNASAISANNTSIGSNSANIATNVAGIAANAAAISALQSDFSGYGVAFSADGALKNVVLMSQPVGGGGTRYYIRSRYENSTEQISIDGTPTVRPFIANYAFAETDSVGNLVSVSNYIEAPDTLNYINYNIEESVYDPVTISKTVTVDTNRESFVCSGGVANVCLVTATENATGNHVDFYTFSSMRKLGGPITVNGMTFNDVRIEETVNRGFSRVRAKGIGEILRMTSGGDRQLIFYRANGVIGGSLVGTPFAAGGPLEGVFF